MRNVPGEKLERVKSFSGRNALGRLKPGNNILTNVGHLESSITRAEGRDVGRQLDAF